MAPPSSNCDNDQNAGCVADASTTDTPKCSTSSRNTLKIGTSNRSGSACTSSSTITDPASRCSFRIAEGFRENSDWNNWTVVVTTTGASQFSAASRPHAPSAPSPSSRTAL
ncbi:hypothetical protein [Streptomyces sp. CBG9]|uniref:hypothetical protein n=1 Tax=Streptomyces sp. CBG9 TaxID=2762622 RepID=UPI001647D6BC